MNAHRHQSSPRILRWSVALSLAMILATIAFPTFAAASEQPVTEDGDLLEAIYQRELELLQQQGERLDQADEIVERAEAYIAAQQAYGVDTSDAEAALADFQDDVAQAQEYYQTASDILSTHVGFDEQGKITDPQSAHETVKSAGEAQRQFHQTILQAVKDLRQELKDTHTYVHLENRYQNELKIQQNQAERLQRGVEISQKMADFIAEEQSKGRDTTILEDALAIFDAERNSAQAKHDAAGTILDEHAGFDAQGKVVDAAQAQDTVIDAQELQWDFHWIAVQALADMRQAMREYIEFIK